MTIEEMRAMSVEALLQVRRQIDEVLAERRQELEQQLEQITGRPYQQQPARHDQAATNSERNGKSWRYRSRKDPALGWSGRGLFHDGCATKCAAQSSPRRIFWQSRTSCPDHTPSVGRQSTIWAHYPNKSAGVSLLQAGQSERRQKPKMRVHGLILVERKFYFQCGPIKSIGRTTRTCRPSKSSRIETRSRSFWHSKIAGVSANAPSRTRIFSPGLNGT